MPNHRSGPQAQGGQVTVQGICCDDDTANVGQEGVFLVVVKKHGVKTLIKTLAASLELLPSERARRPDSSGDHGLGAWRICLSQS